MDVLLATLVIWQSRADSRVHARCAKCWKSSAGVDLHLIDDVQAAFFAVCCWSTRVSLAATCRRFRVEGRPRAHHPPTSEPQACRTCRVELPAAHFYVADNRSGRRTHCMASSAAAKAWSLAALDPLEVLQTKECLECQQELPAAASRACAGCDRTAALRQEQRRATSEQQKERLPSRLPPPPPSASCAACRVGKPRFGFKWHSRCAVRSPSTLQTAMRQRRAARRPAATRQQASA